MEFMVKNEFLYSVFLKTECLDCIAAKHLVHNLVFLSAYGNVRELYKLMDMHL